MKGRLAGLVIAATVAVAGIMAGTSGAGAQALPQANPGGPYSAYLGNTIQFDGTASIGFGLSYAWTFGDGTSASGAQPVKTYAAAGTYTVTLTVTDSAGNQSVASTTATVLTLSSVNTGGCYLASNGAIVCGTIGSAVSGCYLTVAGYVCPAAGVTMPGWLIGSTLTTNSLCADPNYALTPMCLDL